MKKQKKSKSKIDPIVRLAEKNRNEKSYLTFESVEDERLQSLGERRKREQERKEEQERRERENIFSTMQRVYK
jgi:hypothetical protein